MPRVTHFEIAADNPAKIEKFYSKVFGWKFDKWDGPMEYWMIKTGEDKQIGINGGLMKKMQGQKYGLINYVEVESVDQFSNKIKKEGGKIIMPKQKIPKVGYLAICADVEENTFGIIQLDENVK